MSVITFFRKLSDAINKVCLTICVALLGAMVVTTSVQIICRVFFTAISWSEELARYFLIWTSLLGAGCVYKSGSNIAVLFVQGLLPQGLKKFAKILVHILCGFFFALAIYHGIRYMGMMGIQKSAALHIPMKFMYLAIPLGCGIMEFHVIDAILGEIFGKEGEES
ncbi:MAG TPA: TRAP transporter small permease [Clostridium sp.]|uniref:TRAP transporter small permease n=1 Tax=Anaerotignum propionicum TaxID=28446 RepID=UPI000E8FE01E|nr:TRAP transporter small permease [Anaerotignum propionicum]MEA5057081.1 TRAP transporter small permease [Anaerotignum propionicum]HBF64837.1 TRAP transporter small permease [Clostridium sp.]